MSTASVRHLGTNGRWLRAVLALVLGAAQGATALHFVIVKHEYSPATGELVHASRTVHARVTPPSDGEPAMRVRPRR